MFPTAKSKAKLAEPISRSRGKKGNTNPTSARIFSLKCQEIEELLTVRILDYNDDRDVTRS